MRKGANEDISALISNLIMTYEKTQHSTRTISSIAGKSKILSINSAIEAARIGEFGRGFSVISKQIEKFSISSEDANKENQINIQNLNEGINEVVGLRTADVAYDLIDKIDRNLFERNCDVQAWATFEAVVDFGKDPTNEFLQSKVISLLKNLYEIYEVYHDIFMADENGIIVAAANHKEHLGRDVSRESWFIESMNSDGCFVTDMHPSKLVSAYAVSYSSRIKDETGKSIGVLSTRFNWDFIYDILNNAKISDLGEVYLVNNEGTIIASRNEQDVLTNNIKSKYPHLNDVVCGEKYSYFIEYDSKKLLSSVTGCAHTKGYNNYRGKDWSVVVREIITK